MRRHHHLVLLACLLVLAAAAASPAKPKPSSSSAVAQAIAVDFVRRSCRSTRYPRVCESNLVPCAPAVGRSPRRLARAALVVGADRARNCSAYIRAGAAVAGSSKAGKGAMKDCAELARDAEERLRQSAAEMERMGRAGTPRFAWSLGNVQTWASAALTDTDTCLDSLAQARGDRKVDGDAVKRRVVAVAEATSNALALVNRLDPAPHRLL
ncbi:21 kDa protein-like [Panicum miliaceum]|uniref:21 kDa protein-like n=1 Tax=Panicum miliaceum TaxID=4540 RepID=A0A3L6Q4X0_PANMI|nr:21 kDa protein-like [Panicum miliaceum]